MSSAEFATGRGGGSFGGWQRSETRKVGTGLSAIGFSLLLMGCFLLFNRAMLILGNILVIAGLVTVVGLRRAVAFFSRKHKWRGSLSFAIGLLLIFYGRTFIGMIVEVFGILNLFGDFFPYLLSFARQLPIIGRILNLPIFAPIIDRICGVRLPV